ncbi:hypothetical protein H4Q26_002438 [Puccinia striiformis f. sp. tritici PST-130]|uniref:RING-type domain-containing protein n=1 Tax=Puccinia striiformis f. sp. tritici PST-78 TaxID=1165861 RepID=A0A0L0VAP6_9BASI|nr:hypothetical protein Pst134EB_016285 [Puccinia striiformis f. sp. tritici]KAI9603125.1 hypothetical protein H4Q26_002438 [Puccinia striiformis f. sp. tritici PST-130]KNE96049.1 hypothetical protein PSTG_10627 [Puccinia striiformis f. sp. tritici PST-78]
MLIIGFYFICILLVRVSHQTFDRAEQIIANAPHPVPSTDPSSSSEVASEAAMDPSKINKVPPEMTDCPNCLQPLRPSKWDVCRKSLKKGKLSRPKLQLWPGCLHSYHLTCYQQTLDHGLPCSICRMVGPPLTAERKAYLASLPKPPPEMPDDEVAALEIVQTDMDLAENAPEVFSGSAHAASGGSHHDDDRSMAWNAAFDHHGPISGHEHHDIDEALAWAISREENGPHPVHAATHNHHQGHTWGGHDPSEDLALALSLHEELNREALGGAFPAGPSHAAIPEPEHELYMVPDTSRDADLAQRIQAEFSGGAFAAGPSHAAIPEPEHELYMVPDTSRDADLALRIQAQLNEEAQPIPQISSQSRHHGNSQPIPPGFPPPPPQGFPQLPPHGFPQLPPQGYSQAMPHGYQQPMFPVHAAPSQHHRSMPAYPEGYPEPAHQFYGGPSQHHAGGASYQSGLQSMGDWSGALQSVQRGVNQYMDESLLDSLHDYFPQIVAVGLLALFYYMFIYCKDCGKAA